MEQIVHAISDLATENASIPMLARTHGQPASPTTMGKEMAHFAFHLAQHRAKVLLLFTSCIFCKQVRDVSILGKMAGAVGNYNAHLVSYPSIDWQLAAKHFVNKLGKFVPH